MPKPPASPPSSDVGDADHDQRGADAIPDGTEPGETEERAREQSRGRPADTKR